MKTRHASKLSATLDSRLRFYSLAAGRSRSQRAGID